MYSKPVIYLYPPRTMKVSVHLAVSGVITHTDPAIGPTNTWQVVALPDGVLLDSVGRSFPYLFWEADASSAFDMSTGFVVSGADTRLFLATKLNALGLSAREAESFVDYWLPRMKANPYNLIHFEGPAYEQSARLSVSPVPDTQIRVFMVFRSLQTPVSVTAQTLPAPAPRRGFTLVEWGGTELIGR